MKLKAVIFDIDGVLIDSVYANAVFFERFFRKYAPDVKYSKSQYIERNHMTMWDIIKHFTKAESDDEVRRL
ncbi:MAG: hypothetical protein A3H72_03275 [Candidatus Doudnabacteria bacterium RIFCSPLOWO2_02_FULL_48_8]|uniref:HAD family phosphatase n=1 Tax=Candidatus Doudnabacteria bacterium RIFCSPHIGHO2_01_FULL_46_24 TaxID=1817825 RepID=A0A1F5NU58_9BACT|nr:MAG: hypothetical protein A2720_00815 [Candidatus Doudnabacteria bacterium RIFCSPHIGHO2_01_FULL_46_24]OGE94059.1 MAG: hypothetical protein A3E98_01385 [Candidatus Doudnabacteria bacterium RIFCSPHIGHO2_12_FULL_48_11]OGE95116.1 MAG: hypothetical protein A3H72_03275 [Candidatus Doudnabacteria bacterium RIFCSPLOWO2_02_FULL_48_8]